MTGPNDLSVIVTDLSLGAIATFVAILLWSVTRERAWMLVIIAIVLRFGDTVFQVLDRLGIVRVQPVSVLEVPLVWVSLRAVPWIAIVAALVITIRRARG